MKLGYIVAILALVQLPSARGQEEPPKIKKVEIAKNIFLEVEGLKRRVVVNTTVCLREGELEQLLTKKQTKEHEAILAADIDARMLHAALIAAGAQPGKPIQFEPKLAPPSGTVIKITLLYRDRGGKEVRVPAQQWIQHRKGKQDLNIDWVFCGSRLIEKSDRPPVYTANYGDIICVANFPDALLDLPLKSSAADDERSFSANTARIPPLETPVQLILEPVPAKQK